MTDQDLIAKKLAFIETSVRELRELAVPSALKTDLLQRRFVEHTLQLAIQAALDVASHVVSDGRLGEPESNRKLFELLRANHWLSDEQVGPLRNMAGFRNILVHGYAQVDLDLVRDVLENHLDDLLGFVAAIQDQLAARA